MTGSTDPMAVALDRAVERVEISARDLLYRLRIAAAQLAAVASAANTAVDEYGTGSLNSRRQLERVHTFVSATVEGAVALVELAEQLKASLRELLNYEATTSSPDSVVVANDCERRGKGE